MTSPTSSAPKNPCAVTRTSLPRGRRRPPPRAPAGPTRAARRTPGHEASSTDSDRASSGTGCGVGAEVAHHAQRPAVHDQPACGRVVRRPTPGRAAGRTARARPGAGASSDAVPVQHRGVRAAGRLGPVQRRAPRPSPASCGSGTSSAAQPCAANSRRRPARTASASSGSSCEVKYCHGVDAAHSSPMKSIGVNGEVSTSAAATLARPGRHSRRQPVAHRAVADLVVGLGVAEEPPPRHPRRGRPARPSAAPRNDDQVPAWKNAPVSVRCSAANGSAAKSA